jgi:O-antigen ligase
VSLSGAFFFFFALNRGGVNDFIGLSSFFLIINVVLGGYRTEKIPGSYMITAGICAYLALGSVLVSPEGSHARWIVNLVRMLGIIFAVHCLSQKKGIDRLAILFFPILVALVVCWQFFARCLFNLPYGTFTNPHYLASFAVLTLPMIIFFLWITAGWYKFIFVLIAIMDAELLLRTGSRPALIGILFAALFVIVFLTKGRRKWTGMTLICLIVGTLYVTEYAGMAPGIEALLVNHKEEERVQFFGQAWNKLRDNSPMAWIFGHGIAWLPTTYTRDSVVTRFVFPHCHFLEITYLNGVIGVILVFGGLFFLFYSAIRKSRKIGNRKIHILLKCMVVIFLSWFIHSGLTFPFYSKYSLYPLGFILGGILVLVERMDRDKAFIHERLRDTKKIS